MEHMKILGKYLFIKLLKQLSLYWDLYQIPHHIYVFGHFH